MSTRSTLTPESPAADPVVDVSSRRLFNRRARITGLVLAVGAAILIAVPALSGSDGAAVATTVASTTAQVAATAGSSPLVGGGLVTVVGTINKTLANGDLVVNDGHVDYTITLTSTAQIVDLTGVAVARDRLHVDQSVQITGSLSASTITAQTVLVPSNQGSIPSPAPRTSQGNESDG